MRRYVTSCACLIATALAIHIAVVGIADPYGILGTPPLPGLNVLKPQRHTGGGRVSILAELRRAKDATFLFGTSRVKQGFNVSAPSLSDMRIINGGIGGTNLAELFCLIDHAVRANPPRRVIIGVDFLTINAHRTLRADFRISPAAGGKWHDILANKYLTLGAIADSLSTFGANLQDAINLRAEDRHAEDEIAKGANPRKRIERTLVGNFLVSDGTYGVFTYGSDRIRLLELLLGELATQNIPTDLIMTPIHAKQLEAIDLLGIFDKFERMKRELAGLVADVAQAHPDAKIRAWDFTGYGPITAEPVPPYGEDKQMRHYYESSHFRPSVGELVLAKLDGRGPTDFGVELKPETIETHIAAIRRAQEAYRLAQPEEFVEMKRLHAETELRRAENRARAALSPPQPLISQDDDFETARRKVCLSGKIDTNEDLEQ